MAKVKVVFTYIESDGTVGEMERYVPLSRERSQVKQRVTDGNAENYRDGPWASNKEPFEGDLSDEEIAWLRSLHGPNRHWRFSVTEVK